MNELSLQPDRSAPDADDDSLDARIWRAEQRLIAREQRLRDGVQTLTRRARRAVQPQRLFVPLAGVAAGVATLWWLLRGRQPRVPAMQAASAGGGDAAQQVQMAQHAGVPWVRLLGLAWPMLPSRVRDRVSPATASTLLGVGVPMLERLLAKRSTPPLATMPQVDLVRLAGTWHQMARLPQPMDAPRGGMSRVRYVLRLDGRIDLLERRVDEDGRVRLVQGLLQPVPGMHGSQLRFTNWPDVLQVLPMAWSDHWILYVDDDYSELLAGSPTRDQLWLLSRSPQLPPQRLQALVQLAQDRGFAVERLRFGDER